MSQSAPPPIMPGCEPMSHVAGAGAGALVVHGFTGSPASVREVAEAVAVAGFDVELPRLPGHGTNVADMLTTGWADWLGEVERARASLVERCERVVLIGQSMGATLVLASALAAGDPAGIMCINPLTRMRTDEELEMIEDFIEDGFEILPGEGSDIADPDATDIAYDGTPIRPLHSLLRDGVVLIEHRFGELTAPLRLFTSRQDHVVPPADSEHLAGTYGGPVEHIWLERSFHVATRDFDRELLCSAAVDFVTEISEGIRP